MNRGITRWHRLLKHWDDDLRIWLYIAATLFLFRLIFISSYQSLIADTSTFMDVLRVIGHGLRYDLSTAGSWLILTIFLSLLDFGKLTYDLLSWLRRLIILLYVPITILLFLADLLFFSFFGEQFDQRLTGLWQDNQQDLMLTFWKDSHPILYLLAFIIFVYINYRALTHWFNHGGFHLLRYPSRIEHIFAKVGFGLFFIVVVTFVIRGTIDSKPLSRLHAYITEDQFLNKTVLNPYNSLRYFYQDLNDTASVNTLESYWPEGMESAIKTAYPDHEGEIDTFSKLQLKTSLGLASIKPKHIFVIVMESNSGWPLLEDYRNLELSSRLLDLADKGIYLQRYLSDNTSTVANLVSIITSFPKADMKINIEPSSLEPYESSIASQLEASSGYISRFFYGGGLQWRRVGEFAKGQGFSEIYGFNDMKNDAEIMNGWKVHDEYIYRHIDSMLDEKPSLNVVLTTTNHSPYEIDWRTRGYPAKPLPDSIIQTNSDSVYQLGSFWAADRAMGDFVTKVEKRFPNSLFIITADHRDRLGLHFKKEKNKLGNYNVPLVIYGPKVLNGITVDPLLAASHINIGATIMDLALPKGTPYFATSPSIFQINRERYAIGAGLLLNSEFMKPLSVTSNSNFTPEQKSALLQHKALSALVWHRVKKGNKLTQETIVSN